MTTIPTLTDVIRQTNRLLTRHFGALTVITLLYAASSALLLAIPKFVTAKYLLTAPQITGPIGAFQLGSGLVFRTMVPYIASAVITLWSGLLYAILVIRAVKQPGGTTSTTWSEIRYAVIKSIPYALTSLIVMIASFGTFPFLLIPPIIFHVWYSFFPQVIVYEGRWGLSALASSRLATRGMWGNIFFYNALIVLIVLLIPTTTLVMSLRGYWFTKQWFYTMGASPLFTSIIATYLILFRTALYTSLRKINPVKKVSVIPELFMLGLTVVGIALMVWLGMQVREQLRLHPPMMEAPAPTLSPSNTPAHTPTRAIGRIVAANPAGVISNDPQTTKDFIMIGTKLGQYYFQNKTFPTSLSDLANSYLPGDVPINRETGKPFFYELRHDALGKPDMYLFCPEAGATRERCYFQNVLY
jgi:hypothetical protein